MWPVQKPVEDTATTYDICIARTEPTLHKKYLSVRADVLAAAADYESKAKLGQLHLIPSTSTVSGKVTKDEMIAMYDQRFAGKRAPGRKIYDRLRLLPGDRCPFCDHRNVSTLDHILPKALYPSLAVTPINLVGACKDCNWIKRSLAPTSAEEVALHPYFDDISQNRWLSAHVVEQAPVALTFTVDSPPQWSDVMLARVVRQFEALGLAALYSKQAAQEISCIRHNLNSYLQNGGPNAVQKELKRQFDSRRAHRINSWQTATYEALSTNAWFCNGGFLS